MRAPAVLLLVVTASTSGAAQPSLEFTSAEIHLPPLALAETTGATTSPVAVAPAPLPAGASVFSGPGVADPMLPPVRADELVFAWPPGPVRIEGASAASRQDAPWAPGRFCAPMPMRIVNTDADAAILHAPEVEIEDGRFVQPPPVPPAP